MKHLFKLDNQQAAEVITETLEGWKIIDGEPTMKTWILYTSNDGTMMSGIWTTTPGTYHATDAEYEYVHLIEGRCICCRSWVYRHLGNHRASTQAL